MNKLFIYPVISQMFNCRKMDQFASFYKQKSNGFYSRAFKPFMENQNSTYKMPVAKIKILLSQYHKACAGYWVYFEE